MGLKRLWDRVAGAPTRWLMERYSREHPRREYGGIRMIVADEWRFASAERFFERTEQALAEAAARAPQAFAAFRADVQQILLWGETEEPPYHRFQMAAVVPPSVLDSDPRCYAAWLLHTSARPHGAEEARLRSAELLDSLEPDERARVAEWLARTTKGPPPRETAGA
jgi:hypothetical protein